MNFTRLSLGLVLLTITPTTVGCAAKNVDMLHFLRDHEHQVSAIEYRIGIPDAISISAPRVKEIDGQQMRLQPDGKISLNLLGEVKVVDMTAREIASKLEVLLSRYYEDPEVNVRVLSHASKKFYVTGQASTQGPMPYTGRDTVLDAVLNSGISFLSWTSNIKVIRPSHDEKSIRTMHVNVDKMIRTGDWSKNILLEPNDIVHIPPTPLAWIGLRIQELIYPVSPVIQAYTTPLQFQYLADDYQNFDEFGTNGRRGRGQTRTR